MQIGDLVMPRPTRVDHRWGPRPWEYVNADTVGIVIECSHRAIKVLLANGSTQSELVDHWEVINNETSITR